MQQLELDFSAHMNNLTNMFYASLANGVTLNGITLNNKNFKFELFYDTSCEGMYIAATHTESIPSEYRTENLHLPLHHLRKFPHLLERLHDMVFEQFTTEMRRRIELAFVRATLEKQDMSCIGKKIIAKKATVDALWDSLGVLYAGSLVIDCPKAWGGRGYSTLNYRIYSCGKDDTLRYGIYGEVIDYHSDATAGLPVQLPFIEATPAQLADFAGTTREWAAFLRGDK